MRIVPVIAMTVFALLPARSFGGAEAAATPAPATGPAKPAPQWAVQPVVEYFTPFEPASDRDESGELLPLEAATHLGTDFGRMGPGRRRIEWQDGYAKVDLRGAGWAGLWHSLAGLAREKDSTLDFLRCYPSEIVDAKQPRCTGVIVRVGGQGGFKIEVKGADQRILWDWRKELKPSDGMQEFVIDCPPDKLRAAKFLNWVAEPGSQLSVDRLALRIEFPPMSFPERVFLISYAKLARCYVESPPAGSGTPQYFVVKDRAHRPVGSFDAVPATGLFALATSVAWTKGIVERPFAERALHGIHRTIAALPRPDGLLPHFIMRDRSGRYAIHPGTEYSTVDTSLYYHGMILAAQILGDGGTLAELQREVQEIHFDDNKLRDADGWVCHGFREDGRTQLRGCVWRDWGGETALVLLLGRMAAGDRCPLKMATDGAVHDGVGFIGEIQSLFYPQFDQPKPDALTGTDWRQVRLGLLKEQQDYFAKNKSTCAAAQLGLYGLSAGEDFRGRGYAVNGTRRVQAELIHPHYVLMAGRWQPAQTCELLKKMEGKGLLPPWGLVENVKPDLSEYLPMLGSLNAAFECLGSYHLWARAASEPDAIDQAAQACPLTANAIRCFYP
jgi:hypothetical protein